MSTDVQEIADGIYRISTHVEPANLVFNQFLIMAEEPMLWHCGHRRICAATTESDIVGLAIEAEDVSRASAITATTGPVVRSMAARTPHTLALMHGPAFTGDTAGALNALADDYERRLTAQVNGAAQDPVQILAM
ncbi:MAG TPA: hypothetical protein VF506_06980, partial [Streptosporangiaceae bacterium]